jgi:hypothetical protein
MAVCFISLRQVPRFQSCYLIQPSTPPLRNGHTHTETLTGTHRLLRYPEQKSLTGFLLLWSP